MKATCNSGFGARDEMQLMAQLEKDNEWFKSEFENLQEKYQKTFVAIKDGKVIESKADFQELIKTLEQKKENPALILVKFIHEKGISVII